MSDKFDRPETKPQRRYLIVGEPRCGGSMLAEALRLTGQAGVPLEYLNRRLIDAYAARTGFTEETLPLDNYISFLLRRRTTSNGVFVLKALVSQLVPFYRRGPAAVRFLRGFERIVLIHRRDKLAQAISYYRAIETDAWTSLDK
ncbi:MAG: Stf0 family sulfotransferase, partial [Dongiaceae bacterium]